MNLRKIRLGLMIIGLALGGPSLQAAAATTPLLCEDLQEILYRVVMTHIEKNDLTLEMTNKSLQRMVFMLDPQRKYLSEEEAKRGVVNLTYQARSELFRGKCHFFKQIENLVSEAALKQGVDLTEKFESAAPERAHLIIDAVLSVFDPHTLYFTPEDMARMETESAGSIGVVFTIDPISGLPKVDEVMPGSPAEEAGIPPSLTYIEYIDGVPTEGMKSKDIVAKIKGESGSSVTLGLLMPDQCISLNLQRTNVDKKPYLLQSQIVRHEGRALGVITLKEFFMGSAALFDSKVNELVRSGVAGILIDLRENPGGLVNEVTQMGNLLIGDHPIYGRFNGKEVEFVKHETSQKKATSLLDLIKWERSPSPLNIPLVVLVDSGSASASELLAGALKSYRRAIIVSDDAQTFGKGTIQVWQPLDSRKGLVAHTISRFYTPAGYSNQNLGVTPDIQLIDAGEEVRMAPRLERDYPDVITSDSVPGVVTRDMIFYSGDFGGAVQELKTRSDLRMGAIRASTPDDLVMSEGLSILSELSVLHRSLR